MKNLLPHIVMIFGLLLTGCTADDTLTEECRGAEAVDPVGQPVLFTSGSEQLSPTRAGVPYMAMDGRFVCTMYYHPGSGHTDIDPFDIVPKSSNGTATTAWLQVDDNVGNSVYRKADFTLAFVDEDGNGRNDNLDDFGFDKNATMFYWQNRLTHAFLALADYHKLKTNDGATTAQGKLKMFPYGDYVVSSTEEEVQVDDGNGGTTTQTSTVVTVDPTINVYDLTRGDVWAERDVEVVENVLDEDGNQVYEEDGVTPKTTTKTVKEKYLDHYTLNSFTDQPDPIMALTVQKPEGSTQEANRVRLYFKHQFSQIQVNLRGAVDESATITPSQIEKVELLGVSTEGYVANQLNADGTVGNVPAGSATGTMNAASAKEVNLDDFTDEELVANRWGTSFEMFDMATGVLEDGHDTGYATGYLKSYNAIAFGQLWGIRVTWRERSDNTEEAIKNAIRHVSTFEVPLTNETEASTSADDSSAQGDDSSTTPSGATDTKPVVYLRNLQSGMKYIYNLELRRGTLAIIRTVILPWEQKEELVYGTEGTIIN